MDFGSQAVDTVSVIHGWIKTCGWKSGLCLPPRQNKRKGFSRMESSTWSMGQLLSLPRSMKLRRRLRMLFRMFLHDIFWESNRSYKHFISNSRDWRLGKMQKETKPMCTGSYWIILVTLTMKMPIQWLKRQHVTTRLIYRFIFPAIKWIGGSLIRHTLQNMWICLTTVKSLIQTTRYSALRDSRGFSLKTSS